MTDGHSCKDIDECATDNGGCGQICINIEGTYNCSCQQGFALMEDDHGCEDIDECATDNGGCGQICINVEGTYNCSCQQGFALMEDDHGCEDIDECATDNGGCSKLCTNVEGTYNCSCQQGFLLMKNGHRCEDIDECATDNGGCDQLCTNVEGTYNCSCGQGFALMEDGQSCEDIDECATDNGGCSHLCSNAVGTYRCSCRQGFALVEDGHRCDDIDECATDSGGCDQICTNAVATYSCSCRQGFASMGDGYTCEVCGHCQGGDANCDRVSGVCSAGCQVGWKTQLCHEAVDPPVNLIVTDVTEEGFNVTWSPSLDPDRHGYHVVVSKLDMTTAVNQSTDKASFPVSGLSPETDYVIKVTSLVLSGGWRSQSEEAVILAATGARSSTDLQFVEVTDFMVAFTWSPPDAAVTGYRVMYGQEEATEQLSPSPGPGSRSAVIVGLRSETMYKVEITTIGVYRESSPLVGQIKTAAAPTTPNPAAGQTSRMTTTLSMSTSSSSSTTPAKTTRDQGASADDEEIDSVDLGGMDTEGVDSGSYDYSDSQDSGSYGDSDAERPVPTTESNKDATTGKSSKSPGDVRTTSYQAAGDAVEMMETTTAAEENAEDKALDLLESITTTLDEVDMSDPATLESVGGSLLESVGTLLEDPETDAEEAADDGDPKADPAEDESLSPEERLQKTGQQKQEEQAKRRKLVQESRRVLEKMEDAIVQTLKPGAPAVTLSRGGVTLSAQKVSGSEFGSQEVRTGDGGFQLPSQAALFSDYTPHSVTIKLKQFEENPFTWGTGERQVSSTVMELSLQQNNINEALAFNNLTEDFVITIPGSSKNKMATKNITFYSRGNKTAVYHFYNLTDMAEGFMVTIIPLNTSVVYGLSGRYDDRPDDQNYSVSMETYVLPEQCALMKTLSGDEDDVDKTQATMFIKGQRDPAQYYVKVRILGPATECGDEEETDLWDSEEGGFFAYEIQWARLRCVYWNETQETWLTDGCAINNKSTINSTICHCNHLTAFGSDVITPPSKANFGELKFSDVGDSGAVVTAVCVEFWIFVLTMVAIKEMARWKKKLNELDDLQHGDPAHLYIRAGAAENAGKESSIAFKLFGDATTT